MPIKINIIRCMLISCITQLINTIAFSQNLDNIKNEKPVKVNGSFSASSIIYAGQNSGYRRSPFTYFLNGNITISIYGLSVPLSMNYSNQQLSVSQPFNQYGLSPTYKWITVHAGYRSMNFSSYTLAGHTFFGGGVELTPSIFRIAAMYGRLAKAIAFDSSRSLPSYERWGYGLKIGIKKEADFVDLIFFKASDVNNSLPFAAQAGIFPEENVVIGITGSKKIADRLLFSGEYASSAYTRNKEAANDEMYKSGIWNYFPNSYHANNSSIYRNAFKGNLSYAGMGYALQVGYERIDPGYQTLGAYFFNNDLENITFGGQLQLVNNKVQLASQIGLQRNDLDDARASVQRRLISSVNVTTMLNPVTITLSYSNFNMSSKRASQLDPLAIQTDTLRLRFVQVNQNASFSSTYQLSNGESKCSILFNASYQVANDRQGTTEITTNRSVVYTGSIGTTYKSSATSPTLTFTINMNQNEMQSLKTTWLGPCFSAYQSWMKNTLRVTASTSYNQTWVDKVNAGMAITLRVSTTYTLYKQHTFSLSLNSANRINKVQSSNQYMTTINYGYTF